MLELPRCRMRRKHHVCVACANWRAIKAKRMAKRETDYPHTISFRLTDDAWLGIQNQIGGTDLTPHEWCRHAVLEKLTGNYGLSKSERFLFQHLVRAQYLVTQGFQLLADHNLTGEEWKKLRANAKHRASEIAEAALASYAEKGAQRT